MRSHEEDANFAPFSRGGLLFSFLNMGATTIQQATPSPPHCTPARAAVCVVVRGAGFLPGCHGTTRRLASSPPNPIPFPPPRTTHIRTCTPHQSPFPPPPTSTTTRLDHAPRPLVPRGGPGLLRPRLLCALLLQPGKFLVVQSPQGSTRMGLKEEGCCCGVGVGVGAAPTLPPPPS